MSIRSSPGKPACSAPTLTPGPTVSADCTVHRCEPVAVVTSVWARATPPTPSENTAAQHTAICIVRRTSRSFPSEDASVASPPGLTTCGGQRQEVALELGQPLLAPGARGRHVLPRGERLGQLEVVLD